MATSCGGSDPVCGPESGAAHQGLTLTFGQTTLRFNSFTSGANNDCPVDGSATSITIEGAQVDPPATFAFTLCLPSPERISGSIAASDDALVVLQDIGGIDSEGCVVQRDRSAAATGTISFEGFCDNGVHPDGYVVSADAQFPGTRTCMGMPPESVMLTLGGSAIAQPTGI